MLFDNVRFPDVYQFNIQFYNLSGKRTKELFKQLRMSRKVPGNFHEALSTGLEIPVTIT